MTGTGPRFAWFTYDTDARVWRLRVEPGPDLEQGCVLDVPEFTGDLRKPVDMEGIDASLLAVGVRPEGAGWQDVGGNWVTPVVKTRG